MGTDGIAIVKRSPTTGPGAAVVSVGAAVVAVGAAVVSVGAAVVAVGAAVVSVGAAVVGAGVAGSAESSPQAATMSANVTNSPR